MNIGSTTFTVVDFQGQEAEYKEETGHSKTDSIYRRIPHQLLTGVASFNAFTHIFEKRDLKKKRKSNLLKLGKEGLPMECSFSLQVKIQCEIHHVQREIKTEKKVSLPKTSFFL